MGKKKSAPAPSVPEGPVAGYEVVEPSEASILMCAMLCHNVTKALNDAHNEYTVPWEANKGSVLNGIRRYLANPNETPEENHNAWWAYKASEGWKYGVSKDLKAKTHPCMVPYDSLPPIQQAKDLIFRAIVKTMFGLE
jgi:hypothetical protein